MLYQMYTESFDLVFHHSISLHLPLYKENCTADTYPSRQSHADLLMSRSTLPSIGPAQGRIAGK